MMERTIKEASVEGVRMRRKPAKHAVYAVKTTWSDGQVNVVSRRYSEFFDLMKKLVETFPVEGGKTSKERIIPTLHAKRIKFLGNNMMKKIDSVTSFTEKLFLLPQEISQSQIVLDFFTLTEEDMRKRSTNIRKKKKSIFKAMTITGPVTFEEYYVTDDLKSQLKNGLDLKKGQVVEVMEKHETGWWLVCAEGEQGWVPASYLSNEEENNVSMKYEPGYGEIYVSTKKYKAEQQDELSFDVGVHLQIIEKRHDGWWKALYCGREGMVPCTYLKLIGQMNKVMPSKEDGETPRDENIPERKDDFKDSCRVKNDKIIPMVKKDSRSKWTDNIDHDILKKLRDSTLPSPEENNESTKKKKQPAKPRTHLDLRTSIQGGWVPQDIRCCKTYSDNRPKPTHEAKQHFSFTKKLFKSKTIKEENIHKSCIDLYSQDNTSKSLPDGKSNSGHLLVPPLFVTNETKDSIDSARSSNNDPQEFQQNAQSALKTRKDTMGLNFRNNLLSASQRRNKVPLQRTDESPWTHTKKNEKSLSFSCPDLSHSAVMFGENGIFRTNHTLTGDKNNEDKETSQTLWRDDVENGLNESSDELSSSSSEEILVTLQDLEAIGHIPRNMFSSSDSGVDSPWLSSGAMKNGKIYVAIEDFKGSKEDGEVDLFKDQELLVLDKTTDGWWYVEAEERGWAPSKFMEEQIEDFKSEEEPENKVFTYHDFQQEKKMISSSGSCSFEDSSSFIQDAKASNMYITKADFEGSKADGEIDLFENEVVRVLEKTSGGWWLVEGKQGRGWAPSNFLEETSQELKRDLSTKNSQSAFFGEELHRMP